MIKNMFHSDFDHFKITSKPLLLGASVSFYQKPCLGHMVVVTYYDISKVPLDKESYLKLLILFNFKLLWMLTRVLASTHAALISVFVSSWGIL